MNSVRKFWFTSATIDKVCSILDVASARSDNALALPAVAIHAGLRLIQKRRERDFYFGMSSKVERLTAKVVQTTNNWVLEACNVDTPLPSLDLIAPTTCAHKDAPCASPAPADEVTEILIGTVSCPVLTGGRLYSKLPELLSDGSEYAELHEEAETPFTPYVVAMELRARFGTRPRSAANLDMGARVARDLLKDHKIPNSQIWKLSEMAVRLWLVPTALDIALMKGDQVSR
jgi:hypothetical protein